MGFSPIPHYAFRKLTDISAEFLEGLGIGFLMLDLDNTVAAYSEHTPSDSVLQWAAQIKDSGIELIIVSNSVREGRVEAFAEALRTGFVKGASKPSPKVVVQTMKDSGFAPEKSALVGDQIYTDTLAANRAGAVSIIVRPRRFTNPFLAIRYALEAPFRAICRNRMWNAGLGAVDKYTRHR